MSSAKRFYLDYNSTSPLASKVKDFLAQGDFYFANPSSVHRSGKKAKSIIRNTSDFLQDLFSTHHDVLYHSGATEGLNTLIQGHLHENPESTLFYFGTDHSCIRNTSVELKKRGRKVIKLKCQQSETEKIVSELEKVKGQKLLIWTWVNNETGIVSSLDHAVSIKEKTGTKVIVDAVQSIGKIPNWKEISKELDGYVYSGHKFGALKGIGFSLIWPKFSFSPLMFGGGQQRGKRSGTENTLGIQTIQLALEELSDENAFSAVEEMRDHFEKELLLKVNDKIIIVGQDENRSVNTSCLLCRNQRADQLLYKLDMQGIEISSGSACSAGTLKPSETLKSMGYDDSIIAGALRFSFPIKKSQLLSKEELSGIIEKTSSFLT